jgi:5-methylcytosine-specific restriction endonuclease McrA
LLARGRAVVHRVRPFVIRLRDRRAQDSVLQESMLKIDPGSRTSGMTLVRAEETPAGEVHHALFCSEVQHRGESVHRGKQTQSNARRRRRSANLRHRAPRFDTQLLANPEIQGVEYQQGELAGWEVRAYLLLKYEYRCAYCGKTDVPFEIDHIRPRSRGGSNRVSNLALACHACNATKGNQTAHEFGHAEVEGTARRPLRDAAAVNATRFALVEALRRFGLPVGTWTGGRTRWNRARLGIEKTHANDALCVGEIAGVKLGRLKTLRIKATGRGEHCRTNWTEEGFPRGYKLRQKQVRGFKTGDLVRAEVPPPLKTAGMHLGRVAVRASGSLRVGKVDGINARYCVLVQGADGYAYEWAEQQNRRLFPTPPHRKERLLPPHL